MLMALMMGVRRSLPVRPSRSMASAIFSSVLAPRPGRSRIFWSAMALSRSSIE